MDKELAQRIFSCIDNTTLNATDNEQHVEAFCMHTMEMGKVAAVCVYPRFVACAKRTLAGSGIRVASVAGAFPHGQLPISLKVEEVKYAVGEGADEIDMVLSRGALLAGDNDLVRDEVALMKQACQGKTLKVILETGELPSPDLIATASRLAIDGGADFIKTSTGKIATGATLDAAEVMLTVIAEHQKKTGRKVGFKAAGGISTPDEAFSFALLTKKILGDNFIDKQTFRIGASRLTDRLFASLT